MDFCGFTREFGIQGNNGDASWHNGLSPADIQKAKTDPHTEVTKATKVDRSKQSFTFVTVVTSVCNHLIVKIWLDSLR